MSVRLIQGCLFVCLMLMNSALSAEVVIPFELVNGLIVVEAEVDGRVGNFIVDSGSNSILLNGDNASSNVSFETLEGNIEGTEKRINTLKIGNFEQRELLGFTTDLSNLESYLDKEVHGILGCSIFTPHSIVFDFNSSQLIISDQKIDRKIKESLNQLSYFLIEDLPITQLTIQGESYNFVLDSGASSHFIDSDLLDNNIMNAQLTGNSKTIVTAGGKGLISEEYKIKMADLSKEELISDLTGYKKDFSGVSEELGTKIYGLLSLSKLASQKIYFDVVDKKLYF